MQWLVISSLRNVMRLSVVMAGACLSSARSEAITQDQMQAVVLLRQYCQACHAVGDKRFMSDDDDGVVWNFIQTTKPPKGTVTWRDAIIKVLSWPSNKPPPFGETMEPNRDWMPKGGKRLEFSSATYEGQPVRLFILDHL